MSIKDMVGAAKDGKVADFENSFNKVMADKVSVAINNVRQEIGNSVKIDGEEPTGDNDV